MRYKIVIFDGGVEEIVIWAASVVVEGLNVTSDTSAWFRVEIFSIIMTVMIVKVRNDGL